MYRRTRSRKTKLIPRTEEHINTEETHDVQEPSTSGETDPKLLVEAPPGQYDVKVKVEMCDDESESIKFFKPRKKLKSTKSADKQISQYLLDNNEITEKIDYEFSDSLPLAERLLLIAIRNNLGNSLKCPPRAPEDVVMDDAYKAYAKWYEKKKRYLCIIYKCYICKKSWFHLNNFRDHLKVHELDVITVALEPLENTCNIVSFYTKQPEPFLFNSQEICPVCNKQILVHSTNIVCTFCDGAFNTCYAFKIHESTCYNYIACLKKFTQKTTMTKFDEFVCNICMLPFFSPQQIYDHMTLSHCVRSDFLCPWENIKICTFCSDKYVQFLHHACLARTENLPFLNCNRRFHNGYLFQLHHRICKRHYPCRVCNKLLLTECIEKEHLLVHTDNFVNVYKCSLCPNNLLCIDQYSYIKHIEIWHMKTNWKSKITKTDMLAVPKSWVKDAVHYQYDAYTDALKLTHTRPVQENENMTKTQTITVSNELDYNQPDSNDNDASEPGNLDKAPIVGNETELTEHIKEDFDETMVIKTESIDVEDEIMESNIEDFDENMEIKKECENIDDVISQGLEPSSNSQEVDEGLIINIKTEDEEHHIYVECNNINNENDPIKMEYTYNTLMYAAGFANTNNDQDNTSEENNRMNNTENCNNVMNNSVISDTNEKKETIKKKKVYPAKTYINTSNNCETINKIKLNNSINCNTDNKDESDRQQECDDSTTNIIINNGIVIKTEPIDDEDMGELLNIETESESSEISISDTAEIETQTSISRNLDKIFKCKKCNFSGVRHAFGEHLLHCTPSTKKDGTNIQTNKNINLDNIKSEPMDDIEKILNMETKSDEDGDPVNALDIGPEISLTADFDEIYKCKKCKFAGSYQEYVKHVCRASTSSQFRSSLKNKSDITMDIIDDGLAIKSDPTDDEVGDLVIEEGESGIADTVNPADIEPIIKSDSDKINKCTKCDFAGTDSEYLEHTLIHSSIPKGAARFSCSKCFKHYPTLAKYAKHLKIHKYIYLRCPNCDLQFVTMQPFIVHLNSHIKKMFVRIHRIDMSSMDCGAIPKTFLCKACRSDVVPENFFKHWEHHMHMRPIKNKHEDNERPDLKNKTKDNSSAPISDQSVVQDALISLQAGKVRVNNQPKLRTCCVCSRMFTRVNDCKRHLIEHLLANAYLSTNIQDGLKCQICSESFPKAGKYKQHMREHGGLPIYKCTLCSRTFSDSSNFTKHKKVHNLTPYTCDTCGKKFQAKYTMERHVLVHVLTKPLKCDLCEKLFFTESAMKKHKRNVHDKIKAVIQCHICRTTFTSLKDKWDHMWKLHKLRKTEADCPFCSKSYRRFLDLKKHCFDNHNVVLRNMDLTIKKQKKIMKMNCLLMKTNEIENSPETSIVTDSSLNAKNEGTCEM